MFSLIEYKRLALVSVLIGVLAACGDDKSVERVPVPVSVHALRWQAELIPQRLLELRGFYSTTSTSGEPRFYSTEEDAKMWNDAESIPVSIFPVDGPTQSDCVDGYMKAFGYLDQEYDVFWVFVLVPYDENWQETSPCWATSFDWQNSPDYAHLIP